MIPFSLCSQVQFFWCAAFRSAGRSRGR